MRLSLRSILMSAGIAAAVVGGLAPAATAAPLSSRPAAAAPVPAAVPAAVPATGPAGSDVSSVNTGPLADAPVAAALLCTFTTNGDFVHVSSSAFEASGHGWWVNTDCDTSTAVVTVQLQEFFSDGSWRNKGTVGRSTVRSGGGSAARATGRASCANGSVTGWRSVIDVDLVGLADDPGVLITPSQNIGCRQ
jgi:hypothetical protein